MIKVEVEKVMEEVGVAQSSASTIPCVISTFNYPYVSSTSYIHYASSTFSQNLKVAQ